MVHLFKELPATAVPSGDRQAGDHLLEEVHRPGGNRFRRVWGLGLEGLRPGNNQFRAYCLLVVVSCFRVWGLGFEG